MNNRSYKRVSLVVPTRNEEGSVGSLVKVIDFVMKRKKIQYEIIVVDDHSTDKTRELLKKLSKVYPVRVFLKQGQRGKAFSLSEGFKYAQYEAIAMIDADLQYPPEAIPPMLEKLSEYDIVVSNRIQYKASFMRRLMSRTFRNMFGKFLFHLPQDVQSGLKVFKKEIISIVPVEPKTPWTFDLEFLHRAREAGFTIGSHDIEFLDRKAGESSVSFIKSSTEIGLQALLLKMKNVDPLMTAPPKSHSMIGAGVRYKGNRYVTHSTLPHTVSAIETFARKQKVAIFTLFAVILTALIVRPLTTLKAAVAVLSFIYFIDVFFNLYVVLKSLHTPQEISVSDTEIATLSERSLPVYTILCPLYREAHVIPQFVEAISKLDWPKNKLDVQLLLEEDDRETIAAARAMNLPSHFRIVVIPHSFPKTKPKACNYGLSHAKGEFLVIFDAEDMPDPKQLKKAYRAFQKVNRNVLCLQAKLNYYNPRQNLLTRFFTAEYSLWFDVSLTGLQSINTALPLGGTSNHFRTRDLLTLQGWDPFNVTEDADLGVRLFKEGYKTAIIDSVTLEEANSRWGNWLRQRSRWIKGYMQTYLVHNRRPIEFVRENGWHAFIFQLIIGGKIAFILINPLLWLATAAYFTLYRFVGPAIESFYPSLVFYMAVVSLVFGNFLFLFYYMVGIAKREQWDLAKYIFLVPLYWLMISVAGFIALYELIFKPHYWQKTTHGLHLLPKGAKLPKTKDSHSDKTKPQKPDPKPGRMEAPGRASVPVSPSVRRIPVWNGLANLIRSKQAYIGAGALVAATMAANVLNFGFNAYLGRVLSLRDFALVSLVGSLFSFGAVLFAPLGSVLTYRGGFLIGRYGISTADTFWKYIRNRAFIISIGLTAAWVAITPFLSQYFHTDSVLPFLLFAPVVLVGFNTSINKGYISAKLQFGILAAVTIFEPLVKFIAAFFAVQLNFAEYAFLAIPISLVASFFYSSIGVVERKNPAVSAREKVTHHAVKSFPMKFFAASLVSGLSTLSFLSLDVVLAKHYLTADQAGQYSLISLVGKMIYFMASLTIQFIIPLISRREGENKDSKGIFYRIFAATAGLTLPAFIALGLLAQITVPVLFGSKANGILPYLPLFLFAVLCFSLARVVISYYQVKQNYSFPIVGFLLSTIQFVLVNQFHKGVGDMVNAMAVAGIISFVAMALMHFSFQLIRKIEINIGDFFALFTPLKIPFTKEGQNILIFNWRDTRHKWAGGAENYIHEIAKRWAADGNTVVLFCGNDYDSSRDQIVDGVHILRRGGFYTMYFWAVVYYVFKLRGEFDVIIDSENGIPFFTPLFSNTPIFLLIHHVHQEVFLEHLVFPFSTVARFLEGKVMPFIYRNTPVITVSESSKKEIQNLGFTRRTEIQVVNPGITLRSFQKRAKTKIPTIVYVGRLKPYKNIDIAIRAFHKLTYEYPTAQFIIAGEGESRRKLEKLVKKLHLSRNVTFLGKITEKKKIELLGSAWVALQPSMIEGWGITVIEANACGTPVIASHVNGLKDSILDGETGVLVQPKRVDEFAEEMVKIIGNKKLRLELSKNAYHWSRNFSWDVNAHEFFEMIRSEARKGTAVPGLAFAQREEA